MSHLKILKRIGVSWLHNVKEEFQEPRLKHSEGTKEQGMKHHCCGVWPRGSKCASWSHRKPNKCYPGLAESNTGKGKKTLKKPKSPTYQVFNLCIWETLSAKRSQYEHGHLICWGTRGAACQCHAGGRRPGEHKGGSAEGAQWVASQFSQGRFWGWFQQNVLAD